jgi:AcrR family transcriptional regulator
MGVAPEGKKAVAREGREATTAAILDAAEELFAADGYDAVTVRAIAERAGVSHALVHRYLGPKADIFRAVLSGKQGAMLRDATTDPDILAITESIVHLGLTEYRSYARLIASSALHGVPYERTPGRWESVERLVDLAQRTVDSAPAEARTDEDLNPRLVIACITALFLGWGATDSWVLPAVGLQGIDETEALAGLQRIIRGILLSNLPGLADEDPATD